MSDCPYILIPSVKVVPGYLVTYNQCFWTNPAKKKARFQGIMPESNDHKGIVSNRSAGKIKKGISWLLYLAKDKELPSSYHGRTFKFKLSFITLTLSSKQTHSDHEIKKTCLNQFLVEARKKWGLHHYIWRAEAQKNGNIHFHILCDKFIPWSELRDAWNRIQNKLGYVDVYRNEKREFHSGGFQVRQDLLKRWDYKNQLRAYRTGSKNDWNSPNSTDIHATHKIKNLPAYLAKYCTKNQEGRPIEGNLWQMSESLSKIEGAKTEIDSFVSDELSRICKNAPGLVFSSEYFTLITVPVHQWRYLGCDNLLSLFQSYVRQYQDSYT